MLSLLEKGPVTSFHGVKLLLVCKRQNTWLDFGFELDRRQLDSFNLEHMSSSSGCAHETSSSLSTALLMLSTAHTAANNESPADMSDASNEMSDPATSSYETNVGQSKKAALAVGVDVCDNETPPTSTSSSQANTPSSQNNSAKKRGLSEVIRQLHSQKSEHDETDKSGSRTLDQPADHKDENSDDSREDDESTGYEDDFNGDSAAHSADDQHSNHSTKKHKKKKPSSPNSFMTPSSLDSMAKSSGLLKISNASQTRGANSTNAKPTDAVSTGSSANSNSALSNDAHMISAADHLSAIINVVATKDLSPPPIGHSMRSHGLPNSDSKTSSSGNLVDLKNLLERANLVQYLNSFTEQGGDDINQLCEADESEFKEICELVGMATKPLHVKRLRKALDEYKATVRSQPTSQFNYLNLFGNKNGNLSFILNITNFL